jgi:hypothetical protein
VPVEYADGRLDVAAIRFLVGHSSPLAHPAVAAYAAAQAKEAARVAEPVPHVAARWFAWAADAAAAIAEYDGRGQGRPGRKPRPGRDQVLPSQVEALRVPQKRPRRGRPPQSEAPQVEGRYRLVVPPEALGPSEDAQGGTVLAPTVRREGCTDAELLQAYQAHHITVAPGFRWLKNPAAISPVWRENPARIAALARRTVVGLLV